MAGVSPATVNEWLRRGRGLDVRPATPLYVKFAKDVAHSQAIAEMTALATITEAMSRDWRAAAWWLERASPEWRRRKERPTPEPVSAGRMAPLGGTFTVPAEDMRRIIAERLRREEGETEEAVDEETRERRARLVSDRP